MKYEKIARGKFIERPNRFVALVDVDGERVKAHVKNTGRCKEILLPGAVVYLEDHFDRMGTRKMRYSLIAAEKEAADGTMLINMDSQAPNKVVKESLADGSLSLPGMGELSFIKPEAVYGQSRLDFYVKDSAGQEAYIEVKGVTLETDGTAMFPDAPTERGIKHLQELCKATAEGKKAFAIFVVQIEGVKAFSPNDRTHKEFGDCLRKASKEGVVPLAYDCLVRPGELVLKEKIKINL